MHSHRNTSSNDFLFIRYSGWLRSDAEIKVSNRESSRNRFPHASDAWAKIGTFIAVKTICFANISNIERVCFTFAFCLCSISCYLEIDRNLLQTFVFFFRQSLCQLFFGEYLGLTSICLVIGNFLFVNFRLIIGDNCYDFITTRDIAWSNIMEF